MTDSIEEPRATFLSLLIHPAAIRRALIISAIIGTLLILINQGDILIVGGMPPLWKIILTYLVPYGVSSYSTAASLYAAQEDRS